MRTARGVVSQFVYAVFEFVVDPFFKRIGECMRGCPVVSHHSDEEDFRETVTAQRWHGDLFAGLRQADAAIGFVDQISTFVEAFDIVEMAWAEDST